MECKVGANVNSAKVAEWARRIEEWEQENVRE
jgi:hypothetical protein